MSTYAYLWITDIVQHFQSDQDILNKINGDVKGICIMGTVINIMCAPSLEASNSRNLPFIFELDDGSAVIKIVFFCSNQPTLPASGAMKTLASKVNDFCDIRNIVQVGKTIEVKGVPQIYLTTNVEFKAYEIRQVLDLNNELDRMVVVDRWRKQCHWFQVSPSNL